MPDLASAHESLRADAADTSGGPSPEARRESSADLLRRLSEGDIEPEDLSLAQRRDCVAYLTAEGLSVAEISHVLNMSDRTVHRNRRAARRATALHPDKDLGDELLGEFQQLAERSIQRLTRLARDTQTPPSVRLWAEEAILRNYQRFLDAAAKHRYFTDGSIRLARQRRLDRDELQQHLEHHRLQLHITEAENRITDDHILMSTARQVGVIDEHGELTEKAKEVAARMDDEGNPIDPPTDSGAAGIMPGARP